MELFMSLKKMTDSIHKEAEQTKWSKLLVSGNITEDQYGQYLYNLLHIYSTLENRANEHGIFKENPDIKWIRRSLNLFLDLGWFRYETGYEKSTLEYVEYIDSLDRNGILAHMYVRHFGDMYGGSIIAKKIMNVTDTTRAKNMIVNVKEEQKRDPTISLPVFNGDEHVQFYIFENDHTGEDMKETLKEKMRALLDINMSDEAIMAFKFAIGLFHDLEKRFDL
jgi:heme oxygenase